MRAAGRRGTVGWFVPLLAVAPVLLVAGCEFSGQPGSDGPAADTRAPGRPAVVELTPVTRFQGLFTVEDGWRFVPCGEDPIPVEGPAIPDLLEVYDELVPEGAAGMVVDLLGQVRERDGRGWLEAMEVRRAHFEGFGCDDLVRARLEASGTEPFWSLAVDQGTATWTTPRGERRFTHDGLRLDEAGSWRLEARPTPGDEGARPALLVEAWPDPCRNAMSGAYSHLRVEVTLDGELYRGCAVLGAAFEAGLE